jgi:hypothetical protein
VRKAHANATPAGRAAKRRYEEKHPTLYYETYVTGELTLGKRRKRVSLAKLAELYPGVDPELVAAAMQEHFAERLGAFQDEQAADREAFRDQLQDEAGS